MNRRAILAIVRKDLLVVSRNRGVMLPIIIVPLVLFGILPWLAALAPSAITLSGTSIKEFDELLAKMPSGLHQELAGYDMSQKAIVFFLVYLLAPMFLIIPLMVASVIAADSFAGEKERKTLEALLYTPTTDRELFVAKLASAWLAAIAVALVGFALYVVMANAAAWSVMQRVFFPNTMWLMLIIWVVPAVAGLGLCVMVLVSARAQGFQDAYQLGGMIVLPILFLLFGQLSGAMYFSVALVLLLGLVVWLINGVLLWLVGRSFRRERLIVRS